MTVAELGALNGRLTPPNSNIVPLSSTNPSDDFKLTLRSAGSLDLNFSGLSSSTNVVLRSSNAPDRTAQVGSGKVVFTELVKGDYTVHVEASLPNSNHYTFSGVVNFSQYYLYPELNPVPLAAVGSQVSASVDLDASKLPNPSTEIYTVPFSTPFSTSGTFGTITTDQGKYYNGLYDANNENLTAVEVHGQKNVPSPFWAGGYVGVNLNLSMPISSLSTQGGPASLDFVVINETPLSEFKASGFITSTASNSSSTPFTLTLTADYAGNTATAAEAIPPIPTPTPTTSQTQQTYSNPATFKDFIGSSDKDDYYSFKIATPISSTQNGTNVWVELKDVTANTTFELVDSSGKVLRTATATSAKAGNFEQILGSGTYYFHVLSGGGDTNYTLDFASTSLTTSLTFANTGSTKFLTNLWEFDSSGKTSTVGIDPTKQTVLIIHGWTHTGKPEYAGDDLANLAESIIKSNPNEQVLALDWEQAAYEPLRDLPSDGLAPYRAASHVTGVANWAVSELQALGIQPGNVTLIGHSLGSYVADVIGHSSFGKVANLYALDPATTGDNPKPYDLDSNAGGIQSPRSFDSAATNSFAFYSNQKVVLTDSGEQASTAHYSFLIMDTNKHSAGILALNNLVNRGLVAPSFSSLKTRKGKTLIPTLDQFNNLGERLLGGKQEGVMHLKKAGKTWVVDSLEYIDNGRLITDEWKVA